MLESQDDLVKDLNKGDLLNWELKDGKLVPNIKVDQAQLKAYYDALPEEEKTRIANL